MKLTFLSFLLIVIPLSLLSCGKEKLTPIVNPVTVNELRDDQPINFSYKIESTQIDEYAQSTGKFPVFGKLFQAIAFLLANSTISSKGGLELDLEPMEVDLDTVGEIDFDMVEWIRLDSLIAHIDSAKKRDSLEFIEQVEIFALLGPESSGFTKDEKGLTRLVYFDKKIHPIECEGRCLNLRIEKIDWRELIKSKQKKSN